MGRSRLLDREPRPARRRLKPRHVFGALMLFAEAPILGALFAGWLISGLIYAVGGGFERTRRSTAAWRNRQRRPRPQPIEFFRRAA